MKFTGLELRRVAMPLVAPFRTSFGTEHSRDVLLIRAVSEEAAAEMARRHPGVRIAGTYAGSPRDSDWPAILKGIEAAQPNVLLVAYGAPRQDLWIRRHREALPASVRLAMGVGGVFDYISGRVPLAPAAWNAWTI